MIITDHIRNNEIFYNTETDTIFGFAPFSEDILVFLTGQEEIESAVTCTREMGKHLNSLIDNPPLMVFPLYSALPTRQQLEAFKPSPPGSRKVVFSTNIAETSVTIGGTYVCFIFSSKIITNERFPLLIC